MTQNTSFPEPWQSIFNALPPMPSRKQLAEVSGGLVAAGTIANRDSEGRGPEGRRIIGKRTCYPRTEAVSWLMGLEKPFHGKGKVA